MVTTPRRRDGTITMTGDDQAVGEGEDTEGSPHRLQDMTTTGILDTGLFVCLFVLKGAPLREEGMGGVLFMRSQFPTPRVR